ncbi:hypothetical protein F4814DRAFT_284466 [Daldinia grandis]|nr:hypothetical protein F4814DRAFT_284466 [Daldinia grandis]
MAQAIKSALPSHLKPGGNEADSEFAGRHHGKTHSHMVSATSSVLGLIHSTLSSRILKSMRRRELPPKSKPEPEPEPEFKPQPQPEPASLPLFPIHHDEEPKKPEESTRVSLRTSDSMAR